jgi:predicted phosphodiesterase
MKLILIGDLQRTLFVERICGREQNDRERLHVLNQAAEGKADAYWFLGDLVDVGGLSSSWKVFDQVSRAIFQQSAPKNAIFGNHDYWGLPSAVRREMKTRFQNLAHQNFGESRYGSLAVLYLDSNQPMLSVQQWNKQRQWFQDRLEQLENDSTIRDVLVFSHHPPFTNSRRYRGKIDFQQSWVPAFQKQSKTRAWISGHVHAYEHFDVGQKKFLVMGSSGGPRAPLFTGQKQRLPDRCPSPSQPRPFVYSTIEVSAQALRLTVHGFEKGDFNVKTVDFIDFG